MAGSLSAVPFNEVPSNILVPFYWGEFNSGGSPFENFPRPLLVGQTTSAGKAVAGVPYGPVMSHNDAVAQFGPNSMLVGMYDAASAAAPLQPFWALPLADPAGSAGAGSIIFSAPGITAAAILDVMGRQVTFQVNASDTAAMMCANAVAAINALSGANALPGQNVPIIASIDGTNTAKCDVVCAHKGLLGNGLELIVDTSQPNVLNSSWTAAVTSTVASPGVFTSPGGLPSWFAAGTPVVLGGTAVPTGFTAGVTYYAVTVNTSAGTFELSATAGGSAIAVTGAGTAVTASASIAAITALTGGTGTPDLAAPLASLGSTAYDWIAGPYADVSSLNEIKAFLSDQAGRWSPAQQLFGHYTTSFLGQTLSTLVTFGNTRNDQHVCVFGGFGLGVSPSAPWEVAASLVGQEVLHLANPPELSRPLQTLPLPNILPPRDKTSWWTTTERQALYSDGIAAGKVELDGTCQIDRMVTTYQETAQGVPDQTFLDIETMAQGMFAMRYLRTAVTDDWGRAAFADENPFNLPNVATPQALANTLIFAYNDLCALGLAQHPELFQQYVVVVKNALDPDRADAYIPVNVVGQLRVFAANVTAFRSYTSPGGAPLVPSAPGFTG
jgi:phage tail sheath gpL-like